MYQVKIYKKALRSLKKLPLEDKARIKRVFQKLERDPFSLDIKKLGQPYIASHRARVGNYRIFLDIDTELKIIIILEVERRTTQTYR